MPIKLNILSALTKKIAAQSSASTRVLSYQKPTYLATLLLAMIMVGLPSAQAVSLTEAFASAENASGVTKDKPLPVNQAFNVVPLIKGDKLTVNVNVTQGYYAYKDKLNLQLPNGVTAAPFVFNKTPTYVNDPEFGRVPVFEQSFTATTTLTSDASVTNLPVTLRWQGCAKAGLCYPPEKVPLIIPTLTAKSAHKPTPTDSQSKASDSVVASTISNTAKELTTPSLPLVNSQKIDTSQRISPDVASTALASTVTTRISSVTEPTPAADAIMASGAVPTTLPNSVDLILDDVGQQDPFGLQQHTALALALLFLAGLGLAFTPCVLPMLPIVANIIARQHNPSAKKGFLLTGSYSLGVATSYGLLGALVAVFGQSLGLINLLQQPVVLLSFAGLFVLLGLYMLDWLPIRLPARWAIKLQGLSQIGEKRLGSMTGSFITGLLSALVVSPCVSASLAGAVAGVAAIGNPLLGFIALFLLGLGLSTPLIILGATQSNIMPKAGEWMNWVKKGFALLLFAVALLLIERVFYSSLMLLLWAIWFAVVAVWSWTWGGRGQLLSRAMALVLGGWMLCLLAGAAMGSQDSWQPLAKLMSPTTAHKASMNRPQQSSITVKSLAELQPIVAQSPNVIVDVTAAWCIECRIMDKTLFANPPHMLNGWQVVRLDVTDDTPQSKAVYQALQVFGPPVLLYYQHGKLVARQNGEVKRPDFEAILTKLTP